MKRKFIIAIVFFCSLNGGLNASAKSKTKEVTVRTPSEFIAAIGDNRTIVLANDINLSDVLESNTLWNVAGLGNDKKKAVEEYDGYALLLSDISDLTIKGDSEKQLRSIVISPRYAYVFSFRRCKNVNISNLSIGHTVGGYCTGGVLQFEYCRNINVVGCDLYGCGTLGFKLVNVSDFDCRNSTVHHCTYSIMSIEQGNNISFDNCIFADNKEFEQINEYGNTTGFSFSNCRFINNSGPLFSIMSPLSMENCIILHDMNNLGNTYRVSDNRCSWINIPAISERVDNGSATSHYQWKGKVNNHEATIAYTLKGDAILGEMMYKDSGTTIYFPIIGKVESDNMVNLDIFSPDNSGDISFALSGKVDSKGRKLLCFDDATQKEYRFDRDIRTPRYARNREDGAYCSPFVKNNVLPFDATPDDIVGIYKYKYGNNDFATLNVWREGDSKDYDTYHFEFNIMQSGRQVLAEGSVPKVGNSLFYQFDCNGNRYSIELAVFKNFIIVKDITPDNNHCYGRNGLSGIYFKIPSVG